MALGLVGFDEVRCKVLRLKVWNNFARLRVRVALLLGHGGIVEQKAQTYKEQRLDPRFTYSLSLKLTRHDKHLLVPATR